MTKSAQILTLATLSSVAFAPTAFAGDAPETVQNAAIESTSIKASADIEAPMSETTVLRGEEETQLLKSVETGDLIPVEGPDGQIYYNWIVPVSDLPDPDLDLRVLDTIDINYEGEIYTNKLVQELN